MQNNTLELQAFIQPGKRVRSVGIGGVSMRPLGLVLKEETENKKNPLQSRTNRCIVVKN